MKELDVVELTHDIREHDLTAGQTGTIVHIYENGKAYEVEFVASDGKRIAIFTVLPKDIRPYKKT